VKRLPVWEKAFLRFNREIAAGRVDRAERLATKAIKKTRSPEGKAMLLSAIAHLRLTQGRKMDALQLQEQAEAAAPSSPATAIGTAYMMLYQFGDHEAALAKIERAASREARRGAAHHHACQLRGEIAFARLDYRRAAEELLASLDIEDWTLMAAGPETILLEHLLQAGRELDACREYVSRVRDWAEAHDLRNVRVRLHRLVDRFPAIGGKDREGPVDP